VIAEGPAERQVASVLWRAPPGSLDGHRCRAPLGSGRAAGAGTDEHEIDIGYLVSDVKTRGRSAATSSLEQPPERRYQLERP
jgi:hypothetical protein